MIERFDRTLTDRLYRRAGISGLLDRLEYVRQTSEGRYRARCPVHGGDSKDSLGIKACDDGTILVRCYAHECPPADIMASVGLEMGDLFPERLNHDTSPKQKLKWKEDALHREWQAVIKAVVVELRVVWVACKTLRAGNSLDDNDNERLDLAIERIESAGKLFNGT